MAAKGEVDADVARFTKEWQRLRNQRQRNLGGIEARMLLSLAAYMGEMGLVQMGDQLVSRGVITEADKNRLSLVFNMIQKQVRRRIGHLWRVIPDFTASPSKTDSKSYAKADVVLDLMDALDIRLHERTQHWRRLWNTVIFGVGLEHIPWAEDVTQDLMPQFDPESQELLWRFTFDGYPQLKPGTILPHSQVLQLVGDGMTPEWFEVVEVPQIVGEVESEVLCPLNFFIDASVPTIAELPRGQGCFILQLKTEDFIKEVFGSKYLRALSSGVGDDLSIIRTRLKDKGPALSGLNIRDLVPAVQGTRAPDDPPMYVIATRYEASCDKYPDGRRTIFVPGQAKLDDGKCYNGEIPIVDLHYDAPVVSFWTPDFITQLIPAQKFFNKRMSQMGEAANATIHEILLLGGELSKTDIPADLHGVVENGIDENGRPNVMAVQRASLPSWFVESVQAVGEWIQNTGSSDITQTSGQQYGQIRGPLALPILQELKDSEDGPFYSHMGEQLARVQQMRVNRVKEFYPPMRTLHITGRGRKDETLVFHTEEIMRTGIDFSIIVDQATLVPELSALRRARVLEDLNSPLAILYTSRRTGKLDSSKIAKAVRYQDREVEDREVQYRKLAQFFITKLWRGETIPPEVPYPHWDHDAMLDELEAAMATVEWLEASAPVRGAFIAFYEKSRSYLAAIQQAQQDSVQAQMVQGAMAQASQQAAAKAAAVATDSALAQVETSKMAEREQPMRERMEMAFAQNGGPQPTPNAPQPPGVM